MPSNNANNRFAGNNNKSSSQHASNTRRGETKKSNTNTNSNSNGNQSHPKSGSNAHGGNRDFSAAPAATTYPVPTSPNLEALESLNVTATATIPIIDPTGWSGLIQVPVTKTFDTKGRFEYFKGILRKEVSLCCLFQKGRCHAGDKCHQIHVDQTFIKNVRAQNAHVISCCRACKDTASLSSTAVAFFANHFSTPTLKVVGVDGRFSTVKTENISLTIGLTQHVEQQHSSSVTITSLPVKKMCRLHLRGVCKYGKDCKNIHLCTKLGEGILSPTNSPAPEERRGSLSANTAGGSRTPTPTPSSSTKHQRTVSGGIMDRNSNTVSPAPSTSTVQHVATRRTSIVSIDEEVSAVDSTPSTYFNQTRFQPTPALSNSMTPQQTMMEDGAPSSSIDFSSRQGSHQLQREPTILDLNGGGLDSSMMEKSVAVADLCFDPKMALTAASPWDGYDFAPKHQPKKLSTEWLVDDMCGCSSTASHSLTPTPPKASW